MLLTIVADRPEPSGAWFPLAPVHVQCAPRITAQCHVLVRCPPPPSPFVTEFQTHVGQHGATPSPPSSNTGPWVFGTRSESFSQFPSQRRSPQWAQYDDSGGGNTPSPPAATTSGGCGRGSCPLALPPPSTSGRLSGPFHANFLGFLPQFLKPNSLCQDVLVTVILRGSSSIVRSIPICPLERARAFSLFRNWFDHHFSVPVALGMSCSFV